MRLSAVLRLDRLILQLLWPFHVIYIVREALDKNINLKTSLSSPPIIDITHGALWKQGKTFSIPQSLRWNLTMNVNIALSILRCLLWQKLNMKQTVVELGGW